MQVIAGRKAETPPDADEQTMMLRLAGIRNWLCMRDEAYYIHTRIYPQCILACNRNSPSRRKILSSSYLIAELDSCLEQLDPLVREIARAWQSSGSERPQRNGNFRAEAPNAIRGGIGSLRRKWLLHRESERTSGVNANQCELRAGRLCHPVCQGQSRTNLP